MYSYVGRCRYCDGLTATVRDNPRNAFEVARVVAAIIEAGDYVTREQLTELPAACQCPEGELWRTDPGRA